MSQREELIVLNPLLTLAVYDKTLTTCARAVEIQRAINAKNPVETFPNGQLELTEEGLLAVRIRH